MHNFAIKLINFSVATILALTGLFLLPYSSSAAPGQGASINQNLCPNSANTVLESFSTLMPIEICYDQYRNELMVHNIAPYWVTLNYPSGKLKIDRKFFPHSSLQDEVWGSSLPERFIPPGAKYRFDVPNRSTLHNVYVAPFHEMVAFERALDISADIVGSIIPIPYFDKALLALTALGAMSGEYTWGDVNQEIGYMFVEHGVSHLLGETFGQFKGAVIGVATGLVNGYLTNQDWQHAINTYVGTHFRIHPAIGHQYGGDIVKRQGDPYDTAWLVMSDGKRHWIEHDYDYVCFVEQGADVHYLPSSEVHSIPDAGLAWAKCTPDDSDVPELADPWQPTPAVPLPEPVPHSITRNRTGQIRLDFNGDGKSDVFRPSGSYWYVSYGGSSGWKKVNTSTHKLDTLAFGDFNGDNKTDVFTTAGGKWKVSYGATEGWKNINTSSIKVDSLGFADFDGDGKTDVFRSSGGKWYVSYAGTSPWNIRNISTYKIDKLAFGDFNGDGRDDVFRTNHDGWWVSYSGSGPWTKLNSSAYRLKDVALADLNGDGKTDVFRTHWSGKWYVSRGGNTGWKEWSSSGVRLKDLAFADFNGDGKDDVFRTSGTYWYVSRGGDTSWKRWNTSSVKLADLAL